MADYFNKLMTADEIRDAFSENDDKNALCFLLKGVISDLSALEERVEVLEAKVAILEDNEEVTAQDIESIHNSITAIQNSITSINANLAEITANFSNYYTKTETDTLLNAKANSSDVYTKSDVYNKAEIDAMISGGGSSTTIRTNIITSIGTIEE